MKSANEILEVVKPTVKVAQNALPVFLKWVGSKRRFAKRIAPYMPKTYEAYFEPFLGSGAVYFRVRPRQEVSHLSDINADLINLFAQIRDKPEAVWVEMNRHATQHTPDYYRTVRKEIAVTTPIGPTRAGLTLYLNRSCWKGLWRVNLKGEFNVPPTAGRPSYPDLDDLRQVSYALRGVDIKCQSAFDVPIIPGAFYFLDPPYHTTFTGYHRQGFGDQEQYQVADLCRKIDEAGGKFILCNSDTAFVRGLYDRYKRDTLDKRLGKNLKKGGRALAEVVYWNY